MGRGFSRAFLTILLGVAAFFVLQATLQTFRVEGGSMEPGLYQGENLLVNKIAYRSLSHRPVGELTNTGVGAMRLNRGWPVRLHRPLVGPQKGRLLS